MKTKQLTFLLAFTLFFSISSTTNSLVTLVSIKNTEPSFRVISSHFYVGIRDSHSDNIVWTESNFVPLIPDKICYRWDIQLHTEMELVQVKEVFILPAKPKTWVDEEGMSFPLQYDNKVSVRQEAVKLENGTISDGWCVTEGDPTGNHKIDVIINGILAKSFHFTVGLKL